MAKKKEEKEEIPQSDVLAKVSDETQKNIKAYLLYNVVSKQIQELSEPVKLAMVQITPEKVVKTRKVWSQMIPYVQVDYMERALNFISNFKRGVDVVDQWFYEKPVKTNAGKNTIMYEAWVKANFWIILWGEKINRTTFWSWQAYENVAVSKFSVLQSALSMATKNFAETFGIASDRKDEEMIAISAARKEKRWAIIQEYVEENVSIEEASKDFSK